jgi:hypothetical protein
MPFVDDVFTGAERGAEVVFFGADGGLDDLLAVLYEFRAGDAEAVVASDCPGYG